MNLFICPVGGDGTQFFKVRPTGREYVQDGLFGDQLSCMDSESTPVVGSNPIRPP